MGNGQDFGWKANDDLPGGRPPESQPPFSANPRPAAQEPPPAPGTGGPPPPGPSSPPPPSIGTPPPPLPQSATGGRAATRGSGLSTRGKIALVALLLVPALGFGIYSELTTTDVEDLEVGQCFSDWEDLSGGKSGEYVPPELTDSDCAQPHAVEVYHVTEFGRSGSGQAHSLTAIDIATCEREFTSFVGHAPAQSELDFIALTATGGFGFGEKRLICVVGHRDQETLVTGTLRGSQR